MDEPAHDRAKRDDRAILRRVEDSRGAAAFRRWKPRSDDMSVAWEDRRLCKAGEETQSEEGREPHRHGQKSDESSEQGADGPADDADAIDRLRSEPVEKATRGK